MTTPDPPRATLDAVAHVAGTPAPPTVIAPDIPTSATTEGCPNSTATLSEPPAHTPATDVATGEAQAESGLTLYCPSPPKEIFAGRKRESVNPKLVNEKNVKTSTVDWARPLAVKPWTSAQRLTVAIRRHRSTMPSEDTSMAITPEAQQQAASFWKAFGENRLDPDQEAAVRASVGQSLNVSDSPPQSDAMLIDLQPNISLATVSASGSMSARQPGVSFTPTTTSSTSTTPGAVRMVTRAIPHGPGLPNYPPPSHPPPQGQSSQNADYPPPSSRIQKQSQSACPNRVPSQYRQPPQQSQPLQPSPRGYTTSHYQSATSQQPQAITSGVPPGHYAQPYGGSQQYSIQTVMWPQHLVDPPAHQHAPYHAHPHGHGGAQVSQTWEHSYSQPPAHASNGPGGLGHTAPGALHGATQLRAPGMPGMQRPPHLQEGFGGRVVYHEPQPTLGPPPMPNPSPAGQAIHDGFGFQFSDPSTARPMFTNPPPQAPPSVPLENMVRLWQGLGVQERLALMSQLGLQSESSSQTGPAPLPTLLVDADHDMVDESEATQPQSYPSQTGAPKLRTPTTTPRSSPATQKSPKSHLTVMLMNRMHGIEESLDSHGRVQSELLDSVNGLKDKLDNMSFGTSQTPQQSPLKAAAPTCKRGGRSSKSKAARIARARMGEEREDFTQQLLEVNSDDEASDPQHGTPSKPGKKVPPTMPILSLDGWVMPAIVPTSAEEEAIMVAAMSSEQADDVEGTFVNRLQDAVRSHMLWLLDCTELTEIGMKCPRLTDEEMALYTSHKGNYFNRRNFRIDFDRGWVRCSFNREARAFFIRHFLESVAGGSYRKPPIPSRYFTMDQVGGALDSHMEHARLVWRQQVNPPDPDKVARRRVQKQIAGRRRTTYASRAWVVAIYALEAHYDLFSKLQAVHMSGDEADGPTGRLSSIYVIIEAAWQSDEMKEFLRKLDERYIDDWAKGLRHTGGRPPRRRIAKASGAQVVDSEAPSGLWRNCYSKAWIASKPAWYIRAKEIIDADYDFTLNFGGAVSLEQAQETHDIIMQNAVIGSDV